MKRVLLFLVAVVALASCSNDDVMDDVDFVPVEFKFDVTNAAGESLIDKESPAYDSDFVANTYIKFQGKVYKMNEDAEEKVKPSTRAYFEYFHGIMIEQQTAYGTNETKVLAKIGPFLSDYDWKSEEIDIHWGDNSEDKIVFTSVITSIDKKGHAEFSRKHLFNGVDYTQTFHKKDGYMQLVKNSTKGN